MSIRGALLGKLRSWFEVLAAPHPRAGADAAVDHEPSDIERQRELQVRIHMLTWM